METMSSSLKTAKAAPEARFSNRQIEISLSEVETLKKKLADAKAAVQAAKELERQAREEAKAAKKAAPVYNRMFAMCEALKADPTGKREDICKAADQLYIAKTGEPANVVKTSRYFAYCADAYKVFIG
jgi:hypothetical protein